MNFFFNKKTKLLLNVTAVFCNPNWKIPNKIIHDFPKASQTTAICKRRREKAHPSARFTQKQQ